MLDIAVAYNKYNYLGNEFLTWLWYVIENDIDLSELAGLKDKKLTCDIGNSLVLENSLGDNSREKISIKGDDAGLEEGTTALQKGALVTELNLILTIEDNEFRFTIKGESMNISGLKTPQAGNTETSDEVEGAVLEKQFLLSMVFNVIDTLFQKFVTKRGTEEWKTTDIQRIRSWINQPNQTV